MGKRLKKGLFFAGCGISIIGIIGLGVIGFSNTPYDVRGMLILLSMALLAVGILIGTYGFTYETKEEKKARIESYKEWNSKGVPLAFERTGKEKDLPANHEDQLSGLEILDKRYVLGDITREQYLLMKEDLKH